jgi:hypothetical protein
MPLSAQRPENVAGVLAPKLSPNSGSFRDGPAGDKSRNESTSAKCVTGGISPTKLNIGL